MMAAPQSGKFGRCYSLEELLYPPVCFCRVNLCFCAASCLLSNFIQFLLETLNESTLWKFLLLFRRVFLHMDNVLCVV